MKIPPPADNLKQLYGNLTTALNALEDAGEHPLRGFTIFGDGTGDSGTTGENGQVRRDADNIWTSRIDYSDLLHRPDGTHRAAPDAAAATFTSVVAAFDTRMPAHLAQHEHADHS